MSKAPGYVKIHREMLDWEWYQDDRCVRLLLHLHLKANYQPGKWKGNDVNPGQLVTSSVALAEQLGWSRGAVNRTLDKLWKSGEVDTKSDTKWTLVTLIKWDKFQVEGLKPDTKPSNKRTSNGHKTGQQPDTIKEGEEVKNTPSGVGASAATIDQRRQQFVAACRAVIEAAPDRMPVTERKAFVAYWTEPSPSGKMRFEDQRYFDHGRRMDNWVKKSVKDKQHNPRA